MAIIVRTDLRSATNSLFLQDRERSSISDGEGRHEDLIAMRTWWSSPRPMPVDQAGAARPIAPSAARRQGLLRHGDQGRGLWSGFVASRPTRRSCYLITPIDRIDRYAPRLQRVNRKRQVRDEAGVRARVSSGRHLHRRRRRVADCRPVTSLPVPDVRVFKGPGFHGRAASRSPRATPSSPWRILCLNRKPRNVRLSQAVKSPDALAARLSPTPRR